MKIFYACIYIFLKLEIFPRYHGGKREASRSSVTGNQSEKLQKLDSVGDFSLAQLKNRGEMRRKFRDGGAIPAYSPCCTNYNPLYCCRIITFLPRLYPSQLLFVLRAAYFKAFKKDRVDPFRDIRDATFSTRFPFK